MIFEHEIPKGSRLYFGKTAKAKRVLENSVCEILEKYEGDMFKICYNEKSYAYSSCWVCKKVTDLV